MNISRFVLSLLFIGGLCGSFKICKGQDSIIEISNVSTDSKGRVSFDVPVKVTITWTDEFKAGIEPNMLQEIEDNLRVFMIESRKKPHINRFEEGELGKGKLEEKIEKFEKIIEESKKQVKRFETRIEEFTKKVDKSAKDVGGFEEIIEESRKEVEKLNKMTEKLEKKVRKLKRKMEGSKNKKSFIKELGCNLKSGGEWAEVSDRVSKYADNTGLNVIIAPLCPGRYYQFRFTYERSLSDQESNAFKEVAFSALDNLFQKDISGTLQSSVRQDMQRQMLKAVRSVTKATIEPVKNGVFDSSASDEEFKTDAKKRLDKLYADLGALKELSLKDNRELNLKNLDPITRTTGDLNRAVQYLGNVKFVAPTLIAIHGELSQLKGQERNKDLGSSIVLDSLLVFSKAGYQLATMDDTERKYLLNGERVLKQNGEIETSKSFRKVWTLEDMTAKEKNIKTTIQTIEKIIYVVDVFANSTSVEVGKLSKNDLRTLRNVLVNLRDLTMRILVSDTAFSTYKTKLKERGEIFESFLKDALTQEKMQELYATIESNANFQTRAKWYISADLGIVHSPEINLTSPYLGVNLYPFPVNKEAPLRSMGFFPSLKRRTAFMFGLTTQSVARDGQREGVVGNRGLLLGVGFRVSDAIRLSGGTMLFNELEPNPLVNNTSLAYNSFFSISFDWDVRSTLGGLGDIISK